MTPKSPITDQQRIEWAQLAHVSYLHALMNQSTWRVGQIAFHGGTSLHLSWHSPRHSEDLDFLLSSQVDDLDQVTRRVQSYLAEVFDRIKPGLEVSIRDKTRDAARMPSYVVTVSHPNILGAVKVKAEFWRTAPTYLKHYPTALRTPALSNQTAATSVIAQSSAPVPAATLRTAYADKLVAFATRPHLKWRDIFDVWWISTQTQTELNIQDVALQYQHNLSAYRTVGGLEASPALRRWAAQDQAEICARADPDLRTWLPEPLWRRLEGAGISDMVSHVADAVTAVADYLDHSDGELDSEPRLKA